ncbi:MAG TPA: hypothetical protein VMF89_06560, partial [Polyangiales bacterium]|nr:hypothetical protein [Polyangiales bacterium]
MPMSESTEPDTPEAFEDAFEKARLARRTTYLRVTVVAYAGVILLTLGLNNNYRLALNYIYEQDPLSVMFIGTGILIS